MIVDYSEQPSFSEGFVVKVDGRRKLVLYAVVERGRDAVTVSSNLDRTCTWMDLGTEELAAVEKLVEDLRITVNPQAAFTLDGTVHILRIEQGSQELELQWNSSLPKGRGIDWLVEKLKSLAANCKTHGKVKQG